MRHALWLKFIAVALCAAALLAAIGGGLGLAVLASEDLLGNRSYEQYLAEKTEYALSYQALTLAENWASREYGKMPENVAELLRKMDSDSWLQEDGYSYEILDKTGKPLYSSGALPETEQELEFPYESLSYEEFLADGYDQEAYQEEGVYYASHYDNTHGGICYTARNATLETPITLKLYLAPGALEPDEGTAFLGMLSEHLQLVYAALIGGILLFAICAVYLCASAGCRKGTPEIKAGGLNALPLDLYAGGVVLVAVLCVVMLDELDLGRLERQSFLTLLQLAGIMGFVCCLAFVGFCFAFAAQVKMKNHHWFWNSITGRCVKLGAWLVKKGWAVCCRVAPWLWKQGNRIGKGLWKFISALAVTIWGLVRRVFTELLPWFWKQGKRLAKDLWKFVSALAILGWDILKKSAAWLLRQLRRFGKVSEKLFSRLPLIWQWLLVGTVLALWLLVAVAERMEGMVILWCFGALAVVLYGANCFGALLEGAKHMRSGDLESKVDDKYLIGSFREFAGELNGLADVAMVAAQKQLKSDRMKTELITNVSHDIKTPLTSIINYVDLLEKPHTPEQEKTYLEVLSRQSQRMKKLIEDLMEMSKASTGNIQVEIGKIDAVEAVNQALGEFADKLAAAGLTPVFRQSEENVFLLADGRLLWRAMSNVLSNAVKYALPGTRLYVDVGAVEDKAVISFKNISGAQLNISAEELMERFVRGDSSRNTEGSGLGLNIAKSLMELQKGQLQLLVDGDLFKVTLVFPRAE
ncbi:MAG: sensor histidine kinase [Faecousia sp.]